MDATYGPAFDEARDGPRLRRQHEAVRDFCLDRGWLSLREIAAATGYPEASVSAQLRHLRKPRFGGHIVAKRRRFTGTWEYIVRVGP